MTNMLTTISHDYNLPFLQQLWKAQQFEIGNVTNEGFYLHFGPVGLEKKTKIVQTIKLMIDESDTTFTGIISRIWNDPILSIGFFASDEWDDIEWSIN